MTDDANIRMERIQRLFQDLEYEITRGLMEREIDEQIGFEFIVPVSTAIPGGVVRCRFQTRPESYGFGVDPARKLRLVAVKS